MAKRCRVILSLVLLLAALKATTNFSVQRLPSFPSLSRDREQESVAVRQGWESAVGPLGSRREVEGEGDRRWYERGTVMPSSLRPMLGERGELGFSSSRDHAAPGTGSRGEHWGFGGQEGDERDPWEGQDVLNLPYPQGRDPFNPGDRTFWNLPILEGLHVASPATRAGDWLAQIRPLLFDLSEWSQLWWTRVEWEAQVLYRQWSRAPSIEKGLIQPRVSIELMHVRFRRLESRAYGMLQSAVPQSVRDELLATRSLHCVGLLFQILKVYAPGGLQERAQVLTELTNLGSAKGASDIVSALRMWSRCHARAVSMGVNIPDPALILRGVDALVDPVTRKPAYAQVAFRLSSARNRLEIDHRPSMTAVIEYMRILQSEWEQVSVSGQEPGTTAKLAKLDAEPGNKGKGAEKGKQESGGKAETKGEKEGNKNTTQEAQPRGAGGGKGSKGPCSFYLTSKGCCKGRECSHYHDFSAAKGQGRCYNCGSDHHRQQECTRSKGKGKGKPLGESSPDSANVNAAGGRVGTAPQKPEANPPKVAASSVSQASNLTQNNSTTQGSTSSPNVAEAQAQVLDEAHKLLKSLRLAALHVAEASGLEQGSECVGGSETEERKTMVVPNISARRLNAPRKGLLDGGATHSLRTARECEWETSKPTTVELAVGTQELRVSPLGTILTRAEVTPICPLGLLVDRLGCRVDWVAGRCRVTHPLRGLLNTNLEGNCPVVSEALCLELIEELEAFEHDRLQQALAIRALSIGVSVEALESPTNVWGDELELIRWLRESFGSWPERLIRRALPMRCNQAPEGSHSFMSMNRRSRRAIEKAQAVILHMSAGKDKGFQVEGMGPKTVVLRIGEHLKRDLLDEKTFAWLAALCSSGKVSAVVACPPCDTFRPTWSEADDHSGFRDLRGRDGEDRFGLSCNDKNEQERTDDNTVTLLRIVALHHIASKSRDNGCCIALQHPHHDEGSADASCSSCVSVGWWNWPEFQAQQETSGNASGPQGWLRATYEVVNGHRVRHTAMLTNSWTLYTTLHATAHVERPEDLKGRSSGLDVKWQPSVLRAVGLAVLEWEREEAKTREDREGEERAAIRVLSKEEREFREHCEKDHIIFRKDCKVCLQAAMRGPRHIRQKYQNSNALCLSLDLIGPWIKGRDHVLSGPARFILVATLGVPLLRDGQPLLLSEEAGKEKEERSEGKEREEGERRESEGCRGERDKADDDEADDGGGIGEWVLEDEAEGGRDEPDCEDMSDDEYRRLCDEQDEKWKEVAKGLKEPVELHELVFAEPLTSKKASEVLRGVQRIYAKIRLLNLEVRRTHSDGGREFTNRQFRSWCSSRDIHPTYSTPGDPKGNGRIESTVGRIKAGVRALLLSAPKLDKTLWPSALRQHVEQRFRHSAQLLGAAPPRRPLPPFGSEVTVQSRAWSRKTPYAPRAVSGITLCPAANITGCTVVLIPGEEGEESRFHIAPVMYREVKDQVKFEAEEVVGEAVPLEPVPKRRVTGKRPVVAHVSVGGESGSKNGTEAGNDHDADALDAQGASDINSEGPVPDGQGGGDRVRLCNLWGNPWLCRVCEEDGQWREDGRCVECGVKLEEGYTVEKSEEVAEEMMRGENHVSRESIEHILTRSLTHWKPKTRKCDTAPLHAKGWTLGGYVYGNKVGVTNETLRRPQLTKLLNRYLKQLDPEGKWAALRVTCNFAAEPHTDRNLKGSLNFFVPISRFEKGRIWIEGVPGPGEKGSSRTINGSEVEGRWIGGDQGACWFDAAKQHAVEPATGDRRVIIGYTPRLLERLAPGEIHRLRECGFPLPEHVTSKVAVTSKHSRVTAEIPVTSESSHVTAEIPVTSESSHVTAEIPVTSESSHVTGRPVGSVERVTVSAFQNDAPRVVETCLHETEVEQLLHEHFLLRRFMIEQQHHLQEEIGVAANQGWEAVTKPLNELHQWIEDTETWLCWQGAEQQLRRREISPDERVVLSARLRSLGVVSEHEIEPEQPWFDLHDREDLGSGGVGNEAQISEVHPEAWGAEPAQPLQTISVPHSEVLKNIEEWKASIGDELSNVFDVHQAMKRSSNEEIQALRDSGAQIEILPAKALFHLKGGTGRHKCRVVACGNFSENAKAKGRERKLQCYAGGADSLSLRCHLRVAGHRTVTHGWRTSLADIRTAFLLAPLREKTKRTFLRPPTVLRQAGFAAEGEFWEITGALYGMQESPADWASYRDETLPTIGIWIQGKKIFLERSAYDNNMWLLRCPETSGLLAVLSIYVDDLLLSGTPEASEAVWAAIKEKWRISEPEYADLGRAITFCGFEIRQEADGIHVGQAKYVQSLLDKYPEIQGTTTCPYAKESDGVETKPSPSLQNIRRAQALVGEILWLATRTRADLAYGVSRIGQLITRDCDQAIQRGEDMIRYLRATKNQELLYGCPGKGHGPGDQLPVERSFNLMEVFADASFCPGSDRSQSGIILMWGNAPIGWMSMRQACASLSTAEAELQASLDGMTLAEGLHGLLTELAEAPQQAFLYNDNIGACTVLTLPQGSWRTRHLRLKAAWFLEQLECSRFRIYHVPGQYMLGDLCTKSLVGARVKELLNMMSVRVEPSNVDGGESHAVKTVRTASRSEKKLTSGASSGGAERGLKALTAASSLHCVLSKVIKVQIDVDAEPDHPTTGIANTLKLACGVLLVFGLSMLLAWKCVLRETPRIRMVRESENDDEWSLVRSGSADSDDEDEEDDDRVGLGEGLRNRARSTGCGSRSLAGPAPLVPSGSSYTHDGRDEDRGHTSGLSVPSVGCGSRSLAAPAPQVPSGSSDDTLTWRRTVEGVASSSEIAEPPVPEGDAGAGDNSLDGADGGAEPFSGGEGDEVEDLGAEFQTALQPKLAEPQNPVIYPGWPLRVPPRFSWDPEPEWGGPESNFHQRMPARLQQDLWYVDHRRGLITRFHVKPRAKLFLPGPSGWPDGISQDRLTGRRRTLAMLHNPEGQQILEDDWSRTSRPTRLLERKWTGRTEFELRSDQ